MPFDLRRKLAAKAFARTAAYDAAIAQWFGGMLGETMPQRLSLTATLRERLRYGENPHQQAAFYVTAQGHGIGAARQIQGKALSYNNLADADAAQELVSAFEAPAVAIIKHANPCGVAIDDSQVRAYAKALACDPVSAFGGIVALNRNLDAAIAREITKLFTEVVIAPDADDEALALMAAKPNLRLLLTGTTAPADGLLLRSIAGGLLVQERDSAGDETLDLQVVSARPPTEAELADLRFAFAVCKHVKSNAIVFAKDGATVGIGAGQMSRLDSVAIAVRKATEVAAAAGAGAPGDPRQRGRFRCLLPVRRWSRGRLGGGRHRGDPARRQHARCRGDRGRRSRRCGDGVHRPPALSALDRTLRRARRQTLEFDPDLRAAEAPAGDLVLPGRGLNDQSPVAELLDPVGDPRIGPDLVDEVALEQEGVLAVAERGTFGEIVVLEHGQHALDAKIQDLPLAQRGSLVELPAQAALGWRHQDFPSV